MKQMKLYGMSRAFATSLESTLPGQYTPDEMVAFLVDSEWDDRNNHRVARRIKCARFRYKANAEQVDFDIDRNLDRNAFNRFLEGAFIDKAENILITGSTGIGKSVIASALENQACTLGYRVYYASTYKLFAQLKMAKADGSYMKELAKIERHDLLILDDFGLQPFDNHNRASLLEIIEDRHGKHSTIVTSQLPVESWYEVIGDTTIADAIMDRLIHHSHRIELYGESLRKRKVLDA
jgi:DNA replication protein DnaC